MNPCAIVVGLLAVLLAGCSQERTPTELVVTPQGPPESPSELVDQLATAYGELDYQSFLSLLAHVPAGPQFLFLTAPNAGEPHWSYDVEARIHQRMFEPENTPTGQNPVPPEVVLTEIEIVLVPVAPFTERVDLYQSDQNPAGLPANRWKAMDGLYTTEVLFQMQGDRAFLIWGLASFVVIEDLEKSAGELGKHLLWQWNDLPRKPSSEDERTWTEVKRLYN